ncbi:hypothetical protein [Klebsiella pneumoniae]|uniref:hypothetical protein n=1 Tax=Klebsiella pneumoniae TaxID=573 RepID=UPI00115596AF|nr:hypothetical protein [Klebsiella pneumoniae]
MSLVPVEAFVKGFSKNYTFSSVDDGEITNLNINHGHPVNPSFMINVTLKNMNDTHLSALIPDMLNSSKKESESEPIETESFLLENSKEFQWNMHLIKLLPNKLIQILCRFVTVMV